MWFPPLIPNLLVPPENPALPEADHGPPRRASAPRLTDEVGLAGEDGVLQLVGADAELVLRDPVDGDGVVGGRAQLLPDGRRVGRCGRSQVTHLSEVLPPFLHTPRAVSAPFRTGTGLHGEQSLSTQATASVYLSLCFPLN